MENRRIEIRTTGGKGRGLFSLTSFSKGDIIFEEEPIVSCQFAWNKDLGYKACHHCLRPLETAEENARRLAMNSNIKLWYPKQCRVDKSKHVSCPLCYVKYCSSECQMLAWNRYHKTLCLQKHVCDYKHPFEELEEKWKNMHHPPETTSLMLFMRILATIHQAEDKTAISQAIQQFCQFPIDDDDVIRIFHVKRADFLGVIREGLLNCGVGKWAPEWTTPDGFCSLLALVIRNAQSIGTNSFLDWVENVKKLNLDEKEKKFINLQILQLCKRFNHVSGDIVDNQGSGLYSSQSVINHSCRPNALTTFPNSNHRLAVKCIENISAGDEICESYIGECALKKNRHERQEILLWNYFFKCKCQKCEDEIEQPE